MRGGNEKNVKTKKILEDSALEKPLDVGLIINKF
jgi:hypothetical protein